ncbi:MAG: hypothetical protein H7210_01955 [Pyrinomonadaceae bacterium]|nr:hypothetical protein [Phycisphaerales bacterium]
MKRKKGVTRQLIESLAKGASDLCALANQQGMSHIDMARWIERPRHAEFLRLLENLQNRRMSLLLAAARADAAQSLREMAVSADVKETARKACVDLLKLQRDREVSGNSPTDGAGDGDLGPDAYSALNRVLTGISAESRVRMSEHTCDESETLFNAASSAQGGSTRDQATEEDRFEQSDSQDGAPGDHEIGDGAANAHDAAGTA